MAPPPGCDLVQRLAKFAWGDGEPDGNSAVERFARIETDVGHLKQVSYWLAGLVGVAVVEMSVGIGLLLWEWSKNAHTGGGMASFFR